MASLIDLYIAYHKMRTDADEKYPTFMYLQAVGQALGKRSTCDMNPDEEYHNLYILLVGDSFYGRKGVSQDLGMKLYPPDHILPNEFSPEKFIDILSKQPKSVLALGEFSKILKQCKSGKGYMAPIIEIWNDLYRYSRPTYMRDTNTGGPIVVKEPYLCINATCTEEVLKKYIDIEMLTGGFFGRFIIVRGESKLQPRKPLDPEVKLIEKFFQEYFLELEKYFAEHSIKFVFTPEAFDRLNEIEKELFAETQVSAIAGRYGQAMIAIADILAFDDYVSNLIHIINLSDINEIMKKQRDNPVAENYGVGYAINNFHNFNNFNNDLKIDVKFLERAYTIIKPCIEYVKGLKDYVESEPYVAKLRDYMLKHPVCKRSVFMSSTNTSKYKTDLAEHTLEDANQLLVITIKQHGCKDTKCYCWKPAITEGRCAKCQLQLKGYCS